MNKLNTVLAQIPKETETAPSVLGCVNFIKQEPTTNGWIHIYDAAIAALGEILC